MKVYSFYKYDNDNVSIIIVSLSFFEATDAICDMYSNAHLIYNFNEYKTENIIDIKRYVECLNISETYYDYPYFLSKYQYKLLKDKNIIENKNKDNINNIVKCVVDKSIIDNKYNSALPHRNEKTMENCIDRIQNKNHNKEKYEQYYEKEDVELLKNVSNKISSLLITYVDNINDKTLRNDIRNKLKHIYNLCQKTLFEKNYK